MVDRPALPAHDARSRPRTRPRPRAAGITRSRHSPISSLLHPAEAAEHRPSADVDWWPSRAAICALASASPTASSSRRADAPGCRSSSVARARSTSPRTTASTRLLARSLVGTVSLSARSRLIAGETRTPAELRKEVSAAPGLGRRVVVLEPAAVSVRKPDPDAALLRDGSQQRPIGPQVVRRASNDGPRVEARK
jgi:hypothetical protein